MISGRKYSLSYIYTITGDFGPITTKADTVMMIDKIVKSKYYNPPFVWQAIKAHHQILSIYYNKIIFWLSSTTAMSVSGQVFILILTVSI